MSTDRVVPLFIVKSLSFGRTIKSILKIRYDNIGLANVRTQTEFSPESLLRNWFMIVKYDTYDTVLGGGVLCVCVREREKHQYNACVHACVLSSVRICVRVYICFFFFTVFVTSQCDVGIYQHDSLVFCFRDHGTVSAK